MAMKQKEAQTILMGKQRQRSRRIQQGIEGNGDSKSSVEREKIWLSDEINLRERDDRTPLRQASKGAGSQDGGKEYEEVTTTNQQGAMSQNATKDTEVTIQGEYVRNVIAGNERPKEEGPDHRRRKASQQNQQRSIDRAGERKAKAEAKRSEEWNSKSWEIENNRGAREISKMEESETKAAEIGVESKLEEIQSKSTAQSHKRLDNDTVPEGEQQCDAGSKAKCNGNAEEKQAGRGEGREGTREAGTGSAVEDLENGSLETERGMGDGRKLQQDCRDYRVEEARK
jgi:hypothetical protein